MMMSKQPSEKEEETAAIATPAPATLNVGSVADLERRLAEMGTQKNAPPSAAPAAVAPPAYSSTATAVPTTKAQAPVKGGKNALLVRQES
jgi:hypothetical protein